MTGRAVIRAERSDLPHVGRVLIDRPEAANAFSADMCRQFVRALESLERDDYVKVIVIESGGRDLSVGLDPAEVGSYHEQVAGAPEERVTSLRFRLQAQSELFWGRDGMYSRLLTCPKVTILAAKGRCLDVGLFFALYADLVVAGDDAVFGNPRWQHVGVDGDVSMLLATVGRKQAAELMFVGACWSATQARSAGLVTSVASGPDPHDSAGELARTVSTIMRDGIAAEKYLTLASLEKMGIGAGLATATYMGAMASTIHFRDGEFNFLRSRRDLGVTAALAEAKRAKSLRPGRPGSG